MKIFSGVMIIAFVGLSMYSEQVKQNTSEAILALTWAILIIVWTERLESPEKK